MNHFVIGVQSTKRQLDGTPLPRPSGVFTKCAKNAVRREGWLLTDTVTDGNCGPDTMAYYEGLERTQASYCLVRSRIADFMTAKAACPQMQDTFSACCAGSEGEAGQSSGGLGKKMTVVVAAGTVCSSWPNVSVRPPAADASAALSRPLEEALADEEVLQDPLHMYLLPMLLYPTVTESKRCLRW